MLFGGFFAELPDTAGIATALGQARVRVFAEIAAADARLLALSPTEAVRALLARLADGDDLPTAFELIAAQDVIAHPPAGLTSRRLR